MKLIQMITALAISGLMLSAPAAYAEAALTDAQKIQIEGVVHDYIMKNPQVIMEAVTALQKAEYDKMQKKALDTALSQATPLFHGASDPVIGNPNGKVTVVEFFDYQCPHCVDMTPVIDGLLKSNPDLRIVMKDFPIRGPVSVAAAKAAIAANMQGKYWEFHQALMKQAQSLTPEKILVIAKDSGLNVDKLKTDMSSAAVEAQIKATYKLAQDLQLMGTPALFVAKTNLPKGADNTAIIFIPGQADQKALQASIDKTAKS